MYDWEKSLRPVTPYTPGEQPEGDGIVKLNTNECPYPPASEVAQAVSGFDAKNLRLYPDPDAMKLNMALADYYNVSPEQIFTGVGSDDVLAMAFLTFFNSGRPVLFPDITYSFYPVWAELFKIPYKTLPLTADLRINPEDYLIKNGGIVFPNPNAPTGIELSADEIERIVSGNPGSVVIVDEAYIDFGGTSVLPLISRYENLLVVRTFSKSRALAGLRVGFAAGSVKLIRALKAVKFSYNSYTLSSIAIEAGARAVAADDYFKSVIKKITRTRENSANRLKSAGFLCTDSHANFLFVSHPEFAARDIFNFLKENKIYVRYFDQPRIDNFLRITVGTDGQMEKLFRTLEKFNKAFAT